MTGLIRLRLFFIGDSKIVTFIDSMIVYVSSVIREPIKFRTDNVAYLFKTSKIILDNFKK